MGKSQYNPEKHHRRSIRLKSHDYAGGGLYFVTLCAHNRQQLFGSIEGGKVCLTEAGRVAKACWLAIPEHFLGIEPGGFVVMPDHVHGLVRMPASEGAVGAKNVSPIQPPTPSRPQGTSRTLGSVVRGFKVGVTKWVRENTDVKNVWHRNYYEMIVRTPEAEKKIAEYIRMNPWRCVQQFGNGLRGMGNPALWNADKLGILCSRNAPRPKSIPKADVYMSGFHSPMEQEIFKKLLELKKPLVWCPAWGLEKAAFAPGAHEALEENRLLVLEMRNLEGDLAAAEQRNRFVLAQSDKHWLPHVTPGGMLDRLVHELNAGDEK